MKVSSSQVRDRAKEQMFSQPQCPGGAAAEARLAAAQRAELCKSNHGPASSLQNTRAAFGAEKQTLECLPDKDSPRSKQRSDHTPGTPQHSSLSCWANHHPGN